MSGDEATPNNTIGSILGMPANNPLVGRHIPKLVLDMVSRLVESGIEKVRCSYVRASFQCISVTASSRIKAGGGQRYSSSTLLEQFLLHIVV